MAEYNIYGVFEAGDIIKYGYMMIKRPPTSTKVRIKAWQSKFFVLRDKSQNLNQRLEYYKDETAFEFQKPVEYSFNLNSIVYIGETHSSKSHVYPIMIVCSKQGAITLACDNEKATKDWLLAINRVAVKVSGTSQPDIWAHITSDDSPSSTPELQRRIASDLASVRSKSCNNLGEMSPSKPRTPPGYFVTTRLTPHSEKNNIRGDYILCITEEEVSLQSLDRTRTMVAWSVGHLRGFKSEPVVSAGMKDMQLLTLKVGRRSTTGEGVFQFTTKHGDTIADEIRVHSQHAFKSAAEKRDAFRKTTNSSECKSPPSSHPSRKLPRTMTAPPERIANVLQKGITTDSIKRRAMTNPLPGHRNEENGSVQQAVIVDSEKYESWSSDDSRPRSLTESSVEKLGDDEVFVSRQTYTEIDKSDEIADESEMSAYVDLVSDETAEPIHISDPLPSRKPSNDSFTSSSSVGSEEGSMRTNSTLPRSFPGAQLIPEENEMDSEGYIRCEALQTGPAENSLDGNGNVVDYLVSEKRTEIQTSQMSSSHSSSSCPVDATTTAKNGSLEISRVGSRVNRKMRESLFAQIKDPNCGNFPPKPKLEREQALRSENVFPPKPEDDASRFSVDPRNEADSRHSLFDNFRAGDPEASKLMFEKIIAQMEKPQQNDVSELFPTARPKRNSIGAVSSDTVRDVQQRTTMVPGGKTSHFGHKKHAMIEKTKSTSDGFGAPRALSPGPPPLPLRPDPADMTRRRASSSSIGDLSDEIQRRPDWAAAHRSTFFAKGMRSIDPTTLLLPHKTNIDTSHLTGEAAIQARLLEKTEMRDEQASQRRNSAIEEGGSFSCPIPDGGGTDESAFDSSEKGSCKLSENGEDEGHGEVCKRKDSKASKFVKKVWKLAPKPRRGSNDSREISEEVPEKPRRDSLSPGDAMDIQGRFSGSEPSTPETSPKMSRKASKSSPKSSRKTSREEKLKKDKESPEMLRKSSTASKMLRKVHKGSDAKKDDSTVRKASKEESFTDNTVKPLASPNKDKHMKWLPHEKAQKDKRAKSNSESDDMTDAPCQVDGRSEVPSDLTDSQSALSNNTPAPALPPRKKFDPPPLPPRQAKSPTSFSTTPSPVHSSTSHHSGRTSQTAAPPSREGRRHSGQKGIGSILKEEFLPPPPVPPRRENNQSPPDSKKVTSERSSARAAPVIQLTCSSPENRQDSAEKQNSDSEEDVTNATVDKATEQHPPALSANPQSPDSLSHPVPRRPPKPDGERRTQAKEFFRSHVSQRVCNSPTSDSEPTDLDENDSRYGNIEEIRLATSASEHQGASPKAAVSSRHDNPETNCIEKPSPGPLSSGASRVIKSQREAMRLKINLMKESSVDEDPSFENDDGGTTTNVTSEDVKDESAPRRPSTPLSIQRSPLTLSHISSVSIT